MGWRAPQNSEPNVYKHSDRSGMFRPRKSKLPNHSNEVGPGVIATACARQFRPTEDTITDNTFLSDHPQISLDGRLKLRHRPHTKAPANFRLDRRPDPKILALRHLPSPVAQAWEDLGSADSSTSLHFDPQSGVSSNKPIFNMIWQQPAGKMDPQSCSAGRTPTAVFGDEAEHLELPLAQRAQGENGRPKQREPVCLPEILPAMQQYNLEEHAVQKLNEAVLHWRLSSMGALQDNPMFSDASGASSPRRSLVGKHLPCRVPAFITEKLLSRGYGSSDGDSRPAAVGKSVLQAPAASKRRKTRVGRIVAKLEQTGDLQGYVSSECEGCAPRAVTAVKGATLLDELREPSSENLLSLRPRHHGGSPLQLAGRFSPEACEGADQSILRVRDNGGHHLTNYGANLNGRFRKHQQQCDACEGHKALASKEQKVQHSGHQGRRDVPQKVTVCFSTLDSVRSSRTTQFTKDTSAALTGSAPEVTSDRSSEERPERKTSCGEDASGDSLATRVESALEGLRAEIVKLREDQKFTRDGLSASQDRKVEEAKEKNERQESLEEMTTLLHSILDMLSQHGELPGNAAILEELRAVDSRATEAQQVTLALAECVNSLGILEPGRQQDRGMNAPYKPSTGNPPASELKALENHRPSNAQAGVRLSPSRCRRVPTISPPESKLGISDDILHSRVKSVRGAALSKPPGDARQPDIADRTAVNGEAVLQASPLSAESGDLEAWQVEIPSDKSPLQASAAVVSFSEPEGLIAFNRDFDDRLFTSESSAARSSLCSLPLSPNDTKAGAAGARVNLSAKQIVPKERSSWIGKLLRKKKESKLQP